MFKNDIVPTLNNIIKVPTFVWGMVGFGEVAEAKNKNENKKEGGSDFGVGSG